MPKIIKFLFVFIALFSYANQSFALTVSPIRMELRGNPGDTISQEITLLNEGESPQIYYSSYSNFEAQGESGNPAFVEPKEGLGTWMSTVPAINLPPKSAQPVTLNISIPRDAEPGGYFAVVFFGTQPPLDGGQVTIGTKTGILVLLSVNGEVNEAGGLTEFHTKDNKFFYNTLPVDFEYKFKNDGNDRIKPTGNLTIRDTVFLPAEKINGNPVDGNILPGSTRKFELTWVKNPRDENYIPSERFVSRFFDDAVYQWKNFAVGFYSAHLKLTYGLNNTLANTKSVYFFVFPWQLLIILLIVLFVVIFGGKKILRSYNSYIIEKAKAGMGLPHGRSHDK